MLHKDYATAFVIKDYLARIREESAVLRDVEQIKGEFFDKRAVDAQIEELANNSVFVSYAKTNPDDFYTGWKTVQKQFVQDKKSLDVEVRQYENVAKLKKYIIDGIPFEDQDKPQIEELKKAANVINTASKAYERLARVVVNQLLSDNRFKNVLLAVSAGLVDKHQVVNDTADFLRTKDVLSVNPTNGRIGVELITLSKNILSGRYKEMTLKNFKNVATRCT